MKAQFLGLMNRRDLTANDTLAETFIDQAIMRVQRELRVPAMESIVDVTITSDYTGLVIPNDLIELKEIRPKANNVALKKKAKDIAYALSSYVGTPEVYAREGGLWVLGPTPSTGDVIRIVYYAELEPLVAGSDSNIISEIAWDLIVYGACSFACDYFVDKRKGHTVNPMTGEIIDGFEGQYNKTLHDLQDQADQDELGDDAAVEPALDYPCDDEVYFSV